MLTIEEIMETIKMVQEENLDIRTITMGISLRDCQSDDHKISRRKIYDKITCQAEKLVKTGDDIAREYGLPIVNKRISVTPIALVAESSELENYLDYAEVLDQAAEAVGVNFIGGFSALVHKGFTGGDARLIESIPQALSSTERVCASVNVATSRAGINMDAINMCSRVIKNTAELTADKDSVGCAKLVVFANVPEDNPFMAGAFHGIGEPDCVINIGVSGPGVVKSAVSRSNEADLGALSEIVKKITFKITRMGELVGRTAAKKLGVPFGIVDLSLAPTPAIGDSVADVLKEMGLEQCGAPGSTAALALLNDAVKKGGSMASSYVGGLSGAFIPVSEDAGMIQAVTDGALSMEKLEAMTAVCSVGLDMVAVPGNTSTETIAAIIADETAIGVFNHKTTAVRIIPAFGKKTGERVKFGGLLGEAPVMAVNNFSAADFVRRGGRIPAPIHSLNN
ncbi:MAG: PFL family protein [Bacillota bacterium]